MRYRKIMIFAAIWAATLAPALAAENFVPANRPEGAPSAVENKNPRRSRDPLKLKSAFVQKEWERSGLKEFTGGVKSSIGNPVTGVAGFFKKQNDRYQERKAAGTK